jgi:hypothetical protein
LALRLEQAGRNADRGLIEAETWDFIHSLRETMERFKAKLKLDGDLEVLELSDTSKELLREKLLMIKEACETFEINIAHSAMRELRQESWTDEVKESLDKLAEYLLHSRFKKAIKEIDSVLLLIK